MDCSLAGSSVHSVFQVRILEWVAISSSRGSFHPRERTCVSCTAADFCFFFFFLATLGLGCSMRTFSSLCEQGYSLVQLPGLPSRWALLQAGTVACGLQRLPCGGAVPVAAGLVALQHVGSPASGTEPLSPALAGGFMTTEPLGRHRHLSSMEPVLMTE